MSDVEKRVAKQLRRVKEELSRKAAREGAHDSPLAPAPGARVVEALPELQPPPADSPPAPPDGSQVNESWRAPATAPGGIKGMAYRLLDRLLRPRFEAQEAFNAQQVQLDNEILRYLQERSAATHAHYDRLLGAYGRHLGEVDERHLILQEELVSHVADLVKRIDLVLERGERSRLSLEHELRNLRQQLEELRESLGRNS